jgi:hypothetical protein
MDFLRRSGNLREFTRVYTGPWVRWGTPAVPSCTLPEWKVARGPGKAARAAAQGQGFMTYPVAELRLRRALIPLLVGGNTIPVQSLVGTIFEC